MDHALTPPFCPSDFTPFQLSTSGTQWASVSGTVSNRFLVSYRMRAEALSRLVPAPFTLDTHRGHGFLSVCAVEILGMGITALPSIFRFDNREFLYRLGVRYQGRATFITLRSDVSSRALAILGRYFSHYRPRLAEVSLRRDSGRVELTCASRDGHADALLDAELEPLKGPHDSLFSDATVASQFLLGMHFSADVSNGRVRAQAIDHDPWEPRFVRARAARFEYLERLGATLGARFHYDSTLASSNIRQTWKAARWI
ncbi:MAG TPA: DUF2071 domain-containing protein [Polyangiaceae bacterium]|jgi:hypothetical protein|nr:DUF2071 domain-containing protein [Polyangiaceae bacterium]